MADNDEIMILSDLFGPDEPASDSGMAASSSGGTASNVKEELGLEPGSGNGDEGPGSARKRPRSRKGCFAQTAARGQVCKGESQGDAPSPDAKRQRGAEDDGEKNCLGCGRCSHSGHCFLTPHEKVRWAWPASRGQWCKDCHTVWRTCFQQQHSLPFFPEWLAAGNRSTFESYLVAYLSLLVEDQARITATMVHTRARVLAWHSDFMCLHPRSTTIVPLEEVLTPKSPWKQGLQSSHLVTISSKAEDRIGVMVPQTYHAQSVDAIQRPIAEGQVLPFVSRMFLSCTSESDKSALRTAFSHDPEIVHPIAGGEACKEDPDLPMESPSKRSTKVEKRLAALVLQMRPVLQRFGAEEWPDVLESAFTKYVSQFAALLAECGQVGEAAETTGRASSYVEGITAAKIFLKKHRDYVKAHHKVHKLIELGPHLDTFRKFLMAEKFEVAPSLTRVWMKYGFHRDTQQSRFSAAAACTTMIKEGLADCFKGNGGDKSSLQVWLRTMLTQALVEDFEKTRLDTLQHDLPKLSADADGVQESFKKIQDEPLRQALEEIAEDTGAYALVLKAGLEATSVDVASAEAAMIRIKDKHMGVIHKALVESDAGKHILANISSMLQTSGQDVAGNNKLQAVARILQDERLPCTREEEDNLVVTNFTLIANMGVADVFDEVLTNLTEACSMWSRKGLATNAATVSSLVEDTVAKLLQWDRWLCIFMVGVLTRNDAFETALDASSWDGVNTAQEDFGDDLAAVQSLLAEHVPDDTPLVDCGKRCLQFIEALPKDVKDKLDEESIKSRLAVLAQNANTRAVFLEAICNLEDFAAFKIESADFVKGWEAKLATGDVESSSLYKAVRLQDSIASLGESNFKLEEDEDTSEQAITFEGLESEDVKGARATIKATLQAMPLLCAFPWHKTLREAIEGALQLIVDTFASTTHLKTLNPKPTLGVDIGAGQALDAFVPKSKSAELGKIANKILADERADTPWAIDKVVGMLVDIWTTTKADAVTSVNLSTWCRTGCTEDECKLSDKDALQLIGGLYTIIYKTTAVTAWLRQRFIKEGGETCIKDQKLRPEIEKALRLMESWTRKGEDILGTASPEAKAQLSDLPLILPFSSLQQWLSACAIAQTHVHKWMLQVSVNAVDDLATAVRKATPDYEHMCNDAKFARELCKKHLLQAPSRGKLGQSTASLFHALANMARLATLWKMDGPMASDAEMSERVSLAKSTLEKARKTITVLAGVRVICEMKGKEQQTTAMELLSKQKAQLPKALATALEKVL